MEEKCGTCKYHLYFEGFESWGCKNKNSNKCGRLTDCDQKCPDYEKRDVEK